MTGLNPQGLGQRKNYDELTTEELSSGLVFAEAFGTDAQALRDALDAAPENGTVDVTGFPTSVDVTQTIAADRGLPSVSIKADRHTRRQLRLADGADTTLLEYTGADDANFELANLKLEGNKAGQTTATPLVVLDVSADEILRECWINRSKGVGLHKKGGFGALIDHCYIEGHDSWGVDIDESGVGTQNGNVWIRHTKITGNGSGIRTAVTHTLLESCKITTTGGTAVEATGGRLMLNIGNKLVRADGAGYAIDLSGGGHVVKNGWVDSTGGTACNIAADSVRLADLEISAGGGVGIDFRGTNADLNISDCLLTASDRGIIIRSGASDLTTTGGSIFGCGGYAALVAANSTYQGVYFKNNGATSNGEHLNVTGDGKVVGCTIEQESGAGVVDGITVDGATGAQIIGNQFLGADLSTDVVVTANSTDTILWGYFPNGVSDSGTRTIINGRSTNAGDPSTGGQWNGQTALAERLDVTVEDTTNSNLYKAKADGTWSQIGA